jgi:hypothetical protein
MPVVKADRITYYCTRAVFPNPARDVTDFFIIEILSFQGNFTLWYDMIYILNCNWVDTRWQQYSSHLHRNSTQNTENGTYITITNLHMHNHKKLTNLGSAGRAPSLRVIPWHLPYNWGKNTENPQLGQQHVQHKQTHYNTRPLNYTIHRRKTVTQSSTMSQNNKEHIDWGINISVNY